MLSDLILNHWFGLDFSIFNQPPSCCKGSKHATLSSWSEATPNLTVLSDYKNQISASFIAGSLKTQADMNINAQTHHIHAEMLFGVFMVFGASLSQDVSDVTGVPVRSEHIWRRESLGALCNAVVDRVEGSCTRAAKNLSVHGSVPHSTAGCRLRFSWIMHCLPPHGGCRSARKKVFPLLPGFCGYSSTPKCDSHRHVCTSPRNTPGNPVHWPFDGKRWLKSLAPIWLAGIIHFWKSKRNSFPSSLSVQWGKPLDSSNSDFFFFFQNCMIQTCKSEYFFSLLCAWNLV